MVSTRNHPQDFDPNQMPAQTPSKPAPSASQDDFRQGITNTWSHTPSLLTITWLYISLPLVIWDASYVLLRPHSMPGGKYHKPLWTPYGLYGQIDHIYGWPAYNSGNGFTAAQTALNIVETAGYVYYLYLVYAYGKTQNVQGTGAPGKQHVGKLSRSRTVHGRTAAKAVLVLYGIALMTMSKTVLYWLNEAFSGFASIGHNTASDIFFMWVLPNSFWIAFPGYIAYVAATEILQGLDVAVNSVRKSQ